MPIGSYNKSVSSTGVSSTNFSFTKNIEKYIGSAANADGRIAETDVMDFGFDLFNKVNDKKVWTINEQIEVEKIESIILKGKDLIKLITGVDIGSVFFDSLVLAKKMENIINGGKFDDPVKFNLSDGSYIITNGDKTIVYDDLTRRTYEFEGENCIKIDNPFQNTIATLEYDKKGNISGYDVKLIDDNIFSDWNVNNGQYGGYQGSLKNPKFLNDPIVLAIMQRDFPDADLEDYVYYFTAISSVGCAYTAYINYIFEYYQSRGKQDEFEKTFGFPMYTASIDGTVDYNYEYLLLDMFNFCWANKEWSIEELYGDVIINAEDGALIPDYSNKVVDGMNTGDINYNNKPKGGSISEANWWFFNRTGLAYDREYYTNDIGKVKYEAGTPEWYEIVRNTRGLDENEKDLLERNTPLYKKINLTELPVNQKIDWFNNIQKKGVVIITATEFDMNSLSAGSGDYKDVGCHAVTLIEAIDLGLVVSSWGKKYIIPWEDLDKVDNYQVLATEQ